LRRVRLVLGTELSAYNKSQGVIIIIIIITGRYIDTMVTCFNRYLGHLQANMLHTVNSIRILLYMVISPVNIEYN
jgi:hypothetical protein